MSDVAAAVDHPRPLHGGTQQSGDRKGPGPWIALLIALFALLVAVSQLSLDAADKWLHSPEDFAFLSGLWRRDVISPLAMGTRQAVVILSSLSQAHLLPIGQADSVYPAIASVLPVLGGIVAVYASVLGLSKSYDLVDTTGLLRSMALTAMTLLSLPIAGFALVRIMHDQFHFQLTPYAENAITDYRLLVHPAVAWFYGLFSWHPPAWAKDLATISIISVGMNRKARAPKNFGTFGLEFSEFRDWLSSEFHPPQGILDALTWLPHVLAMLFAFALGKLIQLALWPLHALWNWARGRPAFSLPTWLAERVAAVTFVVLRGLMGSGLIFAIEYAWYWLRTLWHFVRGEEMNVSDEQKGAARLYLLYSVSTAALVAAFVLGLRAPGS